MSSKRGKQKQQLSSEISAVLKKVEEGRRKFQSLWDDLHDLDDESASTVKFDKTREELKRELKKLQRLRETVRSLISVCDVKDRTNLTNARKLIESDMERFKVFEKEQKQAAGAVIEGESAAVQDLRAWLHRCIAMLARTSNEANEKLEEFMTNGTRRSRARHTELDDVVRRNTALTARLERLLGAAEDGFIHPEEAAVRDLREIVTIQLEDTADGAGGAYAASEHEYDWAFESLEETLAGDDSAAQRYHDEMAAAAAPPTFTHLDDLVDEAAIRAASSKSAREAETAAVGVLVPIGAAAAGAVATDAAAGSASTAQAPTGATAAPVEKAGKAGADRQESSKAGRGRDSGSASGGTGRSRAGSNAPAPAPAAAAPAPAPAPAAAAAAVAAPDAASASAASGSDASTSARAASSASSATGAEPAAGAFARGTPEGYFAAAAAFADATAGIGAAPTPSWAVEPDLVAAAAAARMHNNAQVPFLSGLVRSSGADPIREVSESRNTVPSISNITRLQAPPAAGPAVFLPRMLTAADLLSTEEVPAGAVFNDAKTYAAELDAFVTAPGPAVPLSVRPAGNQKAPAPGVRPGRPLPADADVTAAAVALGVDGVPLYPTTYPPKSWASNPSSVRAPMVSAVPPNAPHVLSKLGDRALFFAATFSPCSRVRADAGVTLARRGWRWGATGRWVHACDRQVFSVSGFATAAATAADLAGPFVAPKSSIYDA